MAGSRSEARLTTGRRTKSRSLTRKRGSLARRASRCRLRERFLQGLRAESRILEIAGKNVLCVKRGDRVENPPGTITRGHQEDACQALRFYRALSVQEAALPIRTAQGDDVRPIDAHWLRGTRCSMMGTSGESGCCFIHSTTATRSPSPFMVPSTKEVRVGR